MKHRKDSLALLSHLIVWLSFLLIALGDFTRTNSPQFGPWTDSIHSQYDDLPGAGLFLLVFSPFSLAVYLISTALTSGCIQLMLELARSSKTVVKIVSMIVAIFLIFLSMSNLIEALNNLSWQFYIFAMGQLVFSAGVACGVAAHAYTVSD